MAIMLCLYLWAEMAGWVDEMSRNLERWQQMKKRCMVGNMSGAIGTYAAWGGDKGGWMFRIKPAKSLAWKHQQPGGTINVIAWLSSAMACPLWQEQAHALPRKSMSQV